MIDERLKEMAEKLTNDDPAEDLTSDGAISIFMAEAFQTNDTGYIAHALGVVARAALPIFQRQRQPWLEDHAGRDEGIGD